MKRIALMVLLVVGCDFDGAYSRRCPNDVCRSVTGGGSGTSGGAAAGGSTSGGAAAGATAGGATAGGSMAGGATAGGTSGGAAGGAVLNPDGGCDDSPATSVVVPSATSFEGDQCVRVDLRTTCAGTMVAVPLKVGVSGPLDAGRLYADPNCQQLVGGRVMSSAPVYLDTRSDGDGGDATFGTFTVEALDWGMAARKPISFTASLSFSIPGVSTSIGIPACKEVPRLTYATDAGVALRSPTAATANIIFPPGVLNCGDMSNHATVAILPGRSSFDAVSITAAPDASVGTASALASDTLMQNASCEITLTN